MKKSLTIQEFNLFNELLISKSGMQFNRDRIYLLERPLQDRLETLNLSSFLAYYSFLASPEGAEELFYLIQLLTVGETYFFRNENHFTALSDYIFPNLENKALPIQILSAGCSTGDEPYSIVMLSKEFFPDLWIEITATDINLESLDKARKGVYSRRAVQYMPPMYVDKYFEKKAEQYCLSSDIIQNVWFIQGNLMDEQFYQRVGRFDLIICRNVLIYFSKPVIEMILSRFHSILKPHGFLILGHAETIYGYSNDFQSVEQCKTFFYQKKEFLEEQNKTSVQIETPVSAPVPSDRPSSPTSFSTPVHRPPSPANSSLPTASSSVNVLAKTGVEKKIQNPDKEYSKGIQHLINEEQRDAWNTFKKIVEEHPKHIGSLLCMALLEADKNHLGKALNYCQQVLAIDEFSPEAHYIQGLLYENKDQYEEAQKEYNAAVFLKNDFALAHFKLAKNYYSKNKKKEAALGFKNTLKFLAQEPDDPFTIYSGGFPKGTIAQMCRQYLETLN